MTTGEHELTALARDPADGTRAHALSTALAVRAALDPDFGRDLEEWLLRAAETQARKATTANVITGGNYNAPVIQGGSISGITFPESEPPPFP
ncbi:hypothetical protein [Streptomyces sp. T028]|uniref:hypothetical protein n=1 Tax=Streptomyces sp. T028 TaxID=3394379 RepID=UPI003A87039E